MKKLMALALATVVLAPATASAEYLCEKQWNLKMGGSCPSGSVWDAKSATCVLKN